MSYHLLAADLPLAVGPFADWGEVLTALLPTIFLLVGVAGLGSALRQFRLTATIAASDPIDASDVHLEDGVVELEGEVEAVETIESTYTGTECVAYEYEKQERERHHDADGTTHTSYRTLDEGSESVPFRLRDDTGSVVVDPEGATYSLDTEQVSGGSIREYEGRLEPGETVHVYGQTVDAARSAAGETAAETADGAEVDVADGDAVDDFMVSDASETRTILRYGLSGVGRLVLFGAWTAVAGVLFATLVVQGVFGVEISPVLDELAEALGTG